MSKIIVNQLLSSVQTTSLYQSKTFLGQLFLALTLSMMRQYKLLHLLTKDGLKYKVKKTIHLFTNNINTDTDNFTQTSLQYSSVNGPNVDTSQCLTPYQCFSLIFTARVWQFIVDNTNEYAAHKVPKHTSRRSLYSNWTNILIKEMKAFIGIILNMGVIHLSRIKDYWSTLQTCNIPFFRQVMSRNHFSQVFNVLHIREIETTSKMDKVQEFIDLILEISQPLYTLEKKLHLMNL